MKTPGGVPGEGERRPGLAFCTVLRRAGFRAGHSSRVRSSPAYPVLPSTQLGRVRRTPRAFGSTGYASVERPRPKDVRKRRRLPLSADLPLILPNSRSERDAFRGGCAGPVPPSWWCVRCATDCDGPADQVDPAPWRSAARSVGPGGRRRSPLAGPLKRMRGRRPPHASQYHLLHQNRKLGGSGRQQRLPQAAASRGCHSHRLANAATRSAGALALPAEEGQSELKADGPHPRASLLGPGLEGPPSWRHQNAFPGAGARPVGRLAGERSRVSEVDEPLGAAVPRASVAPA